MFNELGHIMKYCCTDEVDDAINSFFIKYVTEQKFLDYFYKTWIASDKIRKFA